MTESPQYILPLTFRIGNFVIYKLDNPYHSLKVPLTKVPYRIVDIESGRPFRSNYKIRQRLRFKLISVFAIDYDNYDCLEHEYAICHELHQDEFTVTYRLDRKKDPLFENLASQLDNCPCRPLSSQVLHTYNPAFNTLKTLSLL